MKSSGLSSISILLVISLGSITLLYSYQHFNALVSFYKVSSTSRKSTTSFQSQLLQKLPLMNHSKTKTNCLANLICYLQGPLLLDFSTIERTQDEVIYLRKDLTTEKIRLNKAANIIVVLGNLEINNLELNNQRDFIILAANNIKINQVTGLNSSNLHLFSYWGNISASSVGDTTINTYPPDQDLTHLKDLLGKLVLEPLPLGINKHEIT